MNKFRVPQKVVEAFADECKDMVQVAARLVVKLEKAKGEERASRRAELLRTLHNVKGAAAAMGFEDAAHLAHLVESLIAAADPARAMEAALADAVLTGVDAIGAHVQKLAQGTAYADAVQLLAAPVQVVEDLVKQAGITPRPYIKAPKVNEKAKPSPTQEATDADAATVRVRSDQLEIVLGATEDLHAAKSRLSARAEEASRMHRLVQSAARTLKRKLSRQEMEPLLQLRQASARLFHDVTTDAQQIETLAEDLTEQMRLLRTVAASSVLDPLERTVRDLASKSGKELVLTIEGRGVEVDRRVLAALQAPLLHLLRNAVDHGIERKEVRSTAGKSVAGHITVRVSVQGELLRAEVEDDGAGVDPSKVRQRAVERGLLGAEEAEALSGSALYEVLFESGFSTAEEITETSGRGVGLDAVREAMHALRGTVQLESQPGTGTRFTLLMPLTVAAIHALIVRVAGQPFAIASQWVKSLGSVSRDQVRVVRGAAYLEDGAQLIPLDRLGQVLRMAAPAEKYARRIQVVRLASAARAAAFAVTDYDDEVELVVKPVAPEFHAMKHLAGVAVLGSGKAVLVLEPEELLRAATGKTGLPEPSSSNGPFTVLVADDSATTRMLHQSALEAAGFKVLTAANGDEALRLLATASCNAVVADVRMPHMSGLELAKAMKQSERLRHLPILLCTGQDSEEDMQAAADAGAAGFLAKSQWERGLLADMVRKALSSSSASLNATGRKS